jgi:DNA-binding LytR/AlgR family response regulator
MAVPRLRGEIEFITIADILYIEADASTTIFNCLDQKFHSSKPFGYYSSLLLQHESFMQISRSCLLNKDLVKKYQPNDRIIRLLNGEELKVSHRYKTYVRNNIDSNQETLMNKAISGLKRLFD